MKRLITTNLHYALWVVLSGCASVATTDQPQSLSEAGAIRIADKFVTDAGLILSKENAARTWASHDAENSLWCVFYVLDTEKLPAGPIVCVNEKTRVAAFSSSM